MSQQATQNNTRKVELEFGINAPVEAVWKALTDAEELTRWFPLHAEVKPGVGGWIKTRWRDRYDFESKIAAWEPNRHIREIWQQPEGAEPVQGPNGPVPLAVDFHLEGQGGSTVLRMVHSGFLPGAQWDEFYDSVNRGWNFELRGLRHYLENHLGSTRRVAWARYDIDLEPEEAWQRFASDKGMLPEGSLAGLNGGDRYAVKAATGDDLAGVVHFRSPKSFCATVDGLNNALMRISIESGSGGEGSAAWEFGAFFSTYGLPSADVEALERRWSEALGKVFGGGAV